MKTKTIILMLVAIVYALLSNAQVGDNNKYYVKLLKKNLKNEILVEQVKQAIHTDISQTSFISDEVRNTNLNKLDYLIIANVKLKKDFISDTIHNVYKWLECDTSSVPYMAIVSKNKKYWGTLRTNPEIIFSPSDDDYESDLYPRIRFFKRLKNLKGESYFKVAGFYNTIWFIRNNKIYVYRLSFKDVYEANEFIHKFCNLDDIKLMLEE